MEKLSKVNRQLFPEPLSKNDENKYLQIFCETRDPAARDILVIHNLRLVAHIAKRYIGNIDTSFTMEDLISVGSLGLVKAVNSFKLGLNVLLATYSSKCIENEILMFLRKTRKHQGVTSLEVPITTDESGHELLINDLLSDKTDFTEQVEINVTIEKLKESVSDKEWRAFELRYLKDLSQRDVAEKLGISQSYVSRLNMRVVKMLKDNILETKSV